MGWSGAEFHRVFRLAEYPEGAVDSVPIYIYIYIQNGGRYRWMFAIDRQH